MPNAAEILAAIKLMKSGKQELDERIQALVAEYVRVEAELVQQTTQDYLTGRLGTLRVRRARIREVRAILDALDKRARPRARKLVRDHFRLGARAATRTRLFEQESSFGKLNRESLDVLLDNLDSRLDEATSTVGRRVEDVFRKEGLRIAAAKLAGNTSLAKATDSLVQSLIQEGLTSFEDKLGRRWGLESYAEMAIRTISSEALAHGTRSAMLSRGFDLVDINRTSNPCAMCIPYNGKTFSLTGKTPGFAALDQLWPFHPRCEHFGLPSPKAADHLLEVA